MIQHRKEHISRLEKEKPELAAKMKEFYKQFGDKLPDGLKQELADLEARLG